MAVTAPPPRRKSPRRQQVENLALAPVDWLEERSGLVGGLRYFLFRNVPSDISWLQTLGSATLTAFIVQAITGVILAMYYRPDPDRAYESIQFITNELTWGWLVRGMHRWGASVFIILLFLHMGRVFLFGAYKYPRWSASSSSRSACSRASPATCCRGTRPPTGQPSSASTSTAPARSSARS
jgi:ubiquinol-cytochrome c reductase cytochrome b subunit/menaquinol-cytochrome c reductase cytochrome b subunit